MVRWNESCEMWYCQCCSAWIWRAEVWVWASVPCLLVFKTIICCEIKDDYVLDNYGKCLSTLTTWVVREGEGWHGSVCMCVPTAVGSSSLSPSCSAQAWNLSGVSQVALNYTSSPSCEGCWVPHTPLTLASHCPAASLVSHISEAVLSLSTPNHFWSMPRALEGHCQGSVSLLAPLIDFPPAQRVRNSRFWKSEC